MTTREEKNKEIQKKLENEEKSKQRSKIIKKIVSVIIIIFFAFLIFILYTHYAATSGLIVKEKRIVEPSLPTSFNGFKIIHFSDLQYGSTVYGDELNSLVKKINERSPSIIVFTGDLIDKNYNISHKEIEKIIKALSNLNADIGKYAVTGDEDNDNFTTILKQAGFTILDNNYDLIYNRSNNPILITGLSSSSKNRDIDKAFAYFNDPTSNKEIYSIVIMHEADSIDEVISKYKVNLALAGGNLNGQIRLPGIGGLLTRENASKYLNEYYKISNTNLYISSGVGTDNNQIRMFNRPSINFFRLATNN